MPQNTNSVISQKNDSLVQPVPTTIVLTYTVQKVVEISIADYTLTPVEIENAIDTLFQENCPNDCEILDSDYSWFGKNREPIPLGCEPTPPNDCWVNINSVNWATNGWCIVTDSCPPINNGNIWNPWYSAKKSSKALLDFFKENPVNDIQHKGFFDRRFLPLKNIPDLKVYGTNICDPGFCFINDQLIAVIMPVDKEADADIADLFQFFNTGD